VENLNRSQKEARKDSREADSSNIAAVITDAPPKVRKAHDDERLSAMLAALHFVAFTCLMLTQLTQLLHVTSSP
jgi:hypothetical protein